MPEFVTTSLVDLPDGVDVPRGFTREELAAFFRGYVTCMLWANVSWPTDTGDAPEGYDNADIRLDEDERRELLADVIDFMVSERGLLLRYVRLVQRGASGDLVAGWEAAGNDFALTRNGHGAGYWDRGLGDLGQTLTEACRPYGSCDVDAWVDEDGDLQWAIS